MEETGKKLRGDPNRQLAFWLAKEVAHTVDVDGMLDSMTPRQFKEWAAMVKIWQADSETEEEKKPSALATMRQLAGV
jgi:hypothetical protein